MIRVSCSNCFSGWQAICLCYSYNSRVTFQLIQSVARGSRRHSWAFVDIGKLVKICRRDCCRKPCGAVSDDNSINDKNRKLDALWDDHETKYCTTLSLLRACTCSVHQGCGVLIFVGLRLLLRLRVKVGHRLLNLCDCDRLLSERCRQILSRFKK